jgi:putative restriction endonuclease
MRANAWNRNELIDALQLYCTTPFGRIHRHNPEIIVLAEKLGRTPSAIALKMTNFASLDPTINRAGMSNSSRLDREVWDIFFDALLLELSSDKSGTDETTEYAESFGERIEKFEYEPSTRIGVDVLRLGKSRLNQDFFRRLVLASYDNKCALTGIDAKELLVASHIVPWSRDASIRTAPSNGICLNALHDRAFDQGLITFDDECRVAYSKRIPKVAREALESFGADRL